MATFARVGRYALTVFFLLAAIGSAISRGLGGGRSPHGTQALPRVRIGRGGRCRDRGKPKRDARQPLSLDVRQTESLPVAVDNSGHPRPGPAFNL